MMRPKILACLVLFLVSSTAGAQPPPEEADALFRQGNSLYKEQRWADARAAFASAWHLKKAHDIAANLAYAEMKLGRFRDAAEHLAFAVKSWPPTGKADKRAYAVEGLQLAKREVGTLTIQVSIPRADVLVDGALVGQAPLGDDVFVEPGSHTIEAKRAGYEDAREAVQAAKGSAQTVTVTLAVTKSDPRISPPPPPPPITEAWRPGAALLVTGGVLAAGGLAAGVALTTAANKKAVDVSQLQLPQSWTCATPSPTNASKCTTLNAAASNKATLSNAAASSFIAGSAFTLVTAGLGIWAATAAPVRAAPTVGVGHVGVTLQGVW